MKVQDLVDDKVIAQDVWPEDLRKPTPKMPDIKVSEAGIAKLLKNLKPKKAAGPDRIKPVFLQELREELAPILKVLFERSLESGAVPHIWNSANVSPIFKKGEISAAANHRPISLTCILCKVMEHIIASNVVKHLDTNGLMYDLQHGFRERRSCETQLASLNEDLARKTSQGKQTYLILLDFSKAFDKVNHTKQLLKLHYYGIRNATLRWIQAFLSNHQQKVVIEGEESDSVPVTSGVPQGSVLGRIFFLTYINDLLQDSVSQVRLFADDTAIYLTLEEKGNSDQLQRDLDRPQTWEDRWNMDSNPSKCQVIRVTSSRTPLQTQYILHGQVLEAVRSARYLGVDISNNLKWNTVFYKIVNGLVAVPLPDYIQPTHRISRFCHSMTFRQIHTGKDYYKCSFFPLAVVQWNALPANVVVSPSLEVFKAPVGELQHPKP